MPKVSNSEYAMYLDPWIFLRDAIKGNTAIKSKRELYLSYPCNMPKTLNDSNYNKFLKLSDFPDLTNLALKAMMGLL